MLYTQCLYNLNNWWLKFFRHDVAFKISVHRVNDIHARGAMTCFIVEAEAPVTVSWRRVKARPTRRAPRCDDPAPQWGAACGQGSATGDAGGEGVAGRRLWRSGTRLGSLALGTGSSANSQLPAA